jgi:hypothetical protein
LCHVNQQIFCVAFDQNEPCKRPHFSLLSLSMNYPVIPEGCFELFGNPKEFPLSFSSIPAAVVWLLEPCHPLPPPEREQRVAGESAAVVSAAVAVVRCVIFRRPPSSLSAATSDASAADP